jgi:DNA-binding GntR family transcriptional regulator
MPAKSDAEARRKAAQREPIKVRGLEGVVDLPKNVIATELRHRIETGIYKPGEAVPSIAELMEMTGTAKNTSRAALDQLRNANYIRTLTGYGTFVNPPEMWNKPSDE